VLTHHAPHRSEVGDITIEIAHDIARKLALPLELIIYKSARTVVEYGCQNVWDITFIARDPNRSETIHFTAPYILIEGSYLVRKTSPIMTNQDVDQPGKTIAVGKGAAYDLYLPSTLKQAKIQRTDGTLGVLDMLLKHDLDVAAGIRQPLVDFATTRDDVRVLPGAFLFIEQAIASPAGRNAANEYLQTYHNDLIRNGYVAKLIKQFGKHPAIVPKLD